MYAGAVPRRATIPSSIEAVASAVMLLAATIASASRVCSSTMLSSFWTRPSAVWSNWKSSAQTWFGRSAHSLAAGTAERPRRLDPNASPRLEVWVIGAGEGIRTLDPLLGKQMLYRLSYSRSEAAAIIA